MRSKSFHGLGMLVALLAALVMGIPAKTQTGEDFYIYDQAVTPDEIAGPTNVTVTSSVINDVEGFTITLKHFWVAISNETGEVQSFNRTYAKLDLPTHTSKTALMIILIEDLAVGDYNVTMKFGYTTPFNSTEVDLLPEVNVTLAVIEPPGGRPRLLLIFFMGTAGFIAAIFGIGIVGTHLERKRRRKE